MDQHAEVVVVGAGHNALVCAGYLAAAGLSVVVLEARPVIGGNTVTEELTLPGWRHDSCATAHVVLQANPLLRDDELGLLARHGLRYEAADPAVVIATARHGPVVLWRDPERAADELRRFDPADGDALLRMVEEWEGGLARVHAIASAGLPLPEGEAAERYRALRARSAREVVESTFRHPVARQVATWLAFATFQPPGRPGTGVLPASILTGRLRHGWATPIGGSSALAEALRAQLEEHGGTVLTDARVTGIEVRDGRAAAVRTADGRRVVATRAIVTSSHLHELPGLLGAATPADVAEASAAWRPGISLFTAHVALEADLRWRTPAGPLDAVAGGLGSPTGLARQLERAGRGELEEDDPWLLVVNSTVVDPGRAPGGTLKLLTNAPLALAGGWSRERAGRYAERLLELVRPHVEGLDGVLAVHSESPEDLARHNPANLGGSCHGGEFELADGTILPGWPGYRTGVAGLYLTGSTSHPGGSVSGRPGRNAARTLLADLGLDPAAVMSTP